MVNVCAAPGTGKTTVLAALIKQARGEVIVDIDELLEDGALLGVPIATPTAHHVWPAYNRMWDKINNFSRRAGHPLIMLTQVPDADEVVATADEPVFWMGWDCPDDLRRARLALRGWDEPMINNAMADAAIARTLFPTMINTDRSHTPEQAATVIISECRRVMRWSQSVRS